MQELTTHQAAEELKLKPGTIRQYVYRGLIRYSWRLGPLLLFSRAEIARFKRTRRKPGNPGGK